MPRHSQNDWIKLSRHDEQTKASTWKVQCVHFCRAVNVWRLQKQYALFHLLYRTSIRLHILRFDLRNFLRHIGIVFSRELFAESPNLVLGLLSVSSERHLCQTRISDRNCGICSLFACYPEASFHDARLFLGGWLWTRHNRAVQGTLAKAGGGGD
jgi:hypothetical protein